MATPRKAVQLAETYISRMVALRAVFAVSSAFFVKHQLTSVFSLVNSSFSALSVFFMCKVSLEKSVKRLLQAPSPFWIMCISKNYYCTSDYMCLQQD